jgi:outer membrane protein assembly factor BamD (BamD/ComL family)
MPLPRQALRTLVAALALLAAAGAAPARAQLGIDLSGPEAKDDKKEEKKKEPGKKEEKARPAPEKRPAVPVPPPPAPRPAQRPAGFEGIDAAGKGQGKARLDAAKRLLAEKEWQTAALAFDAILRDPSLADVHDEARFRLAVALARDGLYHSSLARFDEVLARGAQGSRFFHNSLEWIFYVGRRTANESVILSRVARFAGESFPPGAQDKFHTLLARYGYERGVALAEAGQAAEAKKAFEEARRLTARVKGTAPAPGGGDVEASSPADGNLLARARFVDGLVLYAQGDSQGAVESFKEVVRLTNPRRASIPDPRIRELAFEQLARIHYEYRQNRYAIFYYQRMPWGAPSWLEGLWESSYAWYRIGDYEKALGNLITLHSPYFKDEYFPESYVLKAIIYYENCRYPEARAILEDFNATFEPVYAELDRTTARSAPPAAFYEAIEELDKGRTQPTPAMRKVLKAAFSDRNIERLSVSIREVEAEMDEKLPRARQVFRDSPLAQDLRRQLGAERQRLSAEAGARARQKLEYERDALRELLQQSLRIKIEVSRKEREALEVALASGGKVDVVRPYKFSAAVSDEHLFWPYEGEFWRDELGTYAYTLTKGCRDGPAPVRAR